MSKLSHWYYCRRKILETSQAKLVVKGRKYELPIFDENQSPFENVDSHQQSVIIFKLVKDACLDIFTDAFYPCYNFDSLKNTNKLIFKIGRHMSDDVKNDVKKLTSMVRWIITIRTTLGDLLSDTTCGLVTRTITEIIYDFMNNEFCDIVDKLFNDANGQLQSLDKIVTHFRTDCEVLDKKLSSIKRGDLVGGQVITLFDDESKLQFSASKSFLPQLFKRCVEAGMKHYNLFLHEFFMFGYINSDQLHEFAVWDLNGTEFTSYDLGQPVDKRYELSFDNRFTIIKDLIPSVWKKNNLAGTINLVYKTRKLLFILNSENRKPFDMKTVNLEEFSDPVKQSFIVKQRYDEVNVALLEKINETFNIRELFNFLSTILFNSSSMWINDFVTYATELMGTDPVPEEFIFRLNEYFFRVFGSYYDKLHCRFDVIKLQLYEHGMFDKTIPSDVRLVDLLSPENNDSTDDGVDENNPALASESFPSLGEKDPLAYDISLSGSNASDYQLQLVDQIGIVFHDNLLVKCLIPPFIQEYINKLFRLRLMLAKSEYLLTTKRLESNNKAKMEQLVLFNIQTFLRSYCNTIFGLIVEKQWEKFTNVLKTLKGIDNAVDAEKYLLRDIYSPAGLHSGSSAFSSILNRVLDDVSLYAQDEMIFDDFVDRFYENFVTMRRIVHGYQPLNPLSYSVFRIPPDVKQEKWEAISLDPRKQALAPVQKWGAPIRRSMSYVGGSRRL